MIYSISASEQQAHQQQQEQYSLRTTTTTTTTMSAPVHTWKMPGTKAPKSTPSPSGPNTTAKPGGGTYTKQVQGSGIQDRIKSMEGGGKFSAKPAPTRKMKTPKIVTDTKETFDKEGNITREITRYITEIDGTKRTEKETELIPAQK